MADPLRDATEHTPDVDALWQKAEATKQHAEVFTAKSKGRTWKKELSRQAVHQSLKTYFDQISQTTDKDLQRVVKEGHLTNIHKDLRKLRRGETWVKILALFGNRQAKNFLTELHKTKNLFSVTYHAEEAARTTLANQPRTKQVREKETPHLGPRAKSLSKEKPRTEGTRAEGLAKKAKGLAAASQLFAAKAHEAAQQQEGSTERRVHFEDE